MILSSPSPPPAVVEPTNWRAVYQGIESMRRDGIASNAPVDTMGCERLSVSEVDSPNFRFQTLVGLMLSAQTKDAVTAAAMKNLNARWSDGLTVHHIVHDIDEAELDKLISQVGFHQRKANYIKRTAAILERDYGGDIPNTLQGLMSLPGVGPKMSYLALQVAWRQTLGIGVDTHVHRITNRLGWVHTTTPEKTRMALEQWLPKEYWGKINILLVGFGQKVCLPVGPKCSVCRVNSACPEGRRVLRVSLASSTNITLCRLDVRAIAYPVACLTGEYLALVGCICCTAFSFLFFFSQYVKSPDKFFPLPDTNVTLGDEHPDDVKVKVKVEEKEMSEGESEMSSAAAAAAVAVKEEGKEADPQFMKQETHVKQEPMQADEETSGHREVLSAPSISSALSSTDAAVTSPSVSMASVTRSSKQFLTPSPPPVSASAHMHASESSPHPS